MFRKGRKSKMFLGVNASEKNASFFNRSVITGDSVGESLLVVSFLLCLASFIAIVHSGFLSSFSKANG